MLAQKQEPSTHRLAEAIQGPLPVLTAAASKTLASVRDSTTQLDSLASNAVASGTLGPPPDAIPVLEFFATQLREAPALGRLPPLSPSPSFVCTKEVASTSENVPPANRTLIRVIYW